ncbi:bacillithiol biosynthesis deacetylase BshB1 [Lishizhenia tianjinensis]|uniref:Bacillithiol biosynthesis deacetylase BshB1 n=1 Tax=Lishizhenia tianjinensis TaxID=477690 RepID=A0A1I6YZS3_9FLAO|nr:bacillithiol biosynthesis deacetylase BshB1 [Lishizhenia tianjinensis]SFT55985.1 bacillithiol biosynthesis deacetylase BshB1 [Lishizhenia tianjinensis]
MGKVDILAIGAHPDDVELSCAGTLLKEKAAGKKIAIVDLTEGELGSRGTVQTRYQEAENAGKILGIEARHNLRLADGFFEHTKENLLLLVEQIRRFRPEIVLANAVSDRHPDHGKGAKFISDACFLAGLLKIETDFEGESQEKWRPKAVYHYIQDRHLKPDFVVDVTPYVEDKFKSIFAYETQFYKEGSEGPNTPISGKEFVEFLKGRMREFGRPIGAEFAEGYTVERIAGVNSLFDLI